MNIFFIMICALPIMIFLLKKNNQIAINALWFSIFHFFVYGLIGYAFPGSGADQGIHFIVIATGFLIFWGFLLGYLMISATSGRDCKSRTPHDLSYIAESARLKSAMFIFILFTSVIGWFYFGGFPPVISAISSLIKGQVSSEAAIGVRDFRYMMTKAAYFGEEYRGQGVLRAITYTNSAIIVSYFTFVFALRGTRKAALYLCASFLFAFIFVGGVGDRGPFLEIVLISAAAYSMAKPFRAIHFFKISALSFFVLIILSSLSTKGLHFYRQDGISGILPLIDSLVDRIFRGNSMYDFKIVELVENGRWPLRWGSVHLRNIITAIPGINYGVPVSYELFAYINPGSNRTTFLSGTYLTHTYLDFGWFGSAFMYTLAGMLTAFVARYAESKSFRSIVVLLALPSVYFSLGKVIVYGIPGLIPSLVILFIMVCVLKLFLSTRINFLKLSFRH